MHQIAELLDLRESDKTGFGHIVYEKVANPFGILTICFITLLRLDIYEVTKQNFSKMQKRDPIYQIDSMQTSEKEHLASHIINSLRLLGKEGKWVCL